MRWPWAGWGSRAGGHTSIGTTIRRMATFSAEHTVNRAALALAALLLALSVAACSAASSTPNGSPAAVAPSTTRTSDDGGLASYQAAIASAQAQVAAQVAATDPSELRQLAVTWELTPISGDPLNIARTEWADQYLKGAPARASALASINAQSAQRQAMQMHCFNLARTLIYPKDQQSAQASDRIRMACESEFGVS